MVKIDVKMKAEYIYDLLLFHTYSKFSGFMINVLGLAIIIIGGLSLGMGKMNMFQSVVSIIAGIGQIASNSLLQLEAGSGMDCEYLLDATIKLIDRNEVKT